MIGMDKWEEWELEEELEESYDVQINGNKKPWKQKIRKYNGGKATQKMKRNKKKQLNNIRHRYFEEIDEYDEEIIDKLSNELSNNYDKSSLVISMYHSYFCNKNLIDLLKLSDKQFIGKYIIMSYFNNDNAIFEGKVTCITHCGQYKLENVKYVGNTLKDNEYYNHYLQDELKNNEYYNHYLVDKMKNSYWFHINLTKFVYDENDKDITFPFTDLIKLKLIKYFLYICSFNDDLLNNNKAIKYLINEDRNILICNDRQILKCEYLNEMAIKYVYGTKQNDFKYLRKLIHSGEKKKDKILTLQLKIHHFQLLYLICNYKDLYQQYFKQYQKISINHSTHHHPHRHQCDNYINWDHKELNKTMRTQNNERTV